MTISLNQRFGRVFAEAYAGNTGYMPSTKARLSFLVTASLAFG